MAVKLLLVFICCLLENQINAYPIRLVGGSGPHEGRVEIHHNNSWGTVCDDNWGVENARATCKELGFERSGALAKPRAYFGQGTGPIWIDDVNCTYYSALSQCRHNGLGIHNCQHSEDASVICQPSVRLVGGSGSHHGRVEVYHNNQWGTVCDDSWGQDDAAVVCRQLGFNPLRAIARSTAFYGQGTGQIWLDDVNCTGSERSIVNCGLVWGVHNCGHAEDAGVDCQEHTIRLVNGSSASSNEGRVEIFRNNQWGTVCDDGWDNDNAAVVCRELGFSSIGAITKHRSYFGKGNGSIWLDGVSCLGHESSLESCRHNSWAIHDCSHYEDVSVICQVKIRLVNGTTSREGRVEVSFQNEWGTVCDDNWGSEEAAAVCEQLGFSPYSAIARHGAYFGQGTGPIWLDDVVCPPLAPSLANCSHAGVQKENCGHAEDASVICHDIRYRLVGGQGPREGRLEMFYNTWATVCDYNSRWEREEARVACRVLGYPTLWPIVIDSSLYAPRTMVTVRQLWNINCTGYETHLTKCANSGIRNYSCSHPHDVFINCAPNNMQYRLAGGSNSREGRVEVLINNVWNTICDAEWSTAEASVVCRELGYATSRAVTVGGAFFGEGNGHTLKIEGIHCSGSETTLTQCKHRRWSLNSCSHVNDVSVYCRPAIRLEGGQGNDKGRVEVFHNGAWGTVCDSGWGQEEAAVVCREMLLPEAQGAIAKGGAYFGPGPGLVVYDNVQCSGTESSIEECAKTTYNIGCGHGQDASVLCLGSKDFDVAPYVNVSKETNTDDRTSLYIFYCDFPSRNEHLTYRAAWYIDGTIVYTSPAAEGNDPNCRRNWSLNEGQLNRSAGFDIMCEILASETANSSTTASRSEKRFVGIRVLTPLVHVKEGEVCQIRVKLSDEIGCSRQPCKYRISPDVISTGTSTGCSGSAKPNRRCNINLLEGDWDQEYNISIATDVTAEYGESTRQFNVALRYNNPYHDHVIWGNYAITPLVTVIVVKNTSMTQSLVCSSEGDPRLKTFKNVGINVQTVGVYTLYFDEEHDIEVQMQTIRCSDYVSGHCNCGMIARVGGTAYMISKCDSDNWIIQYVLCDDGIDALKVEKHGNYKITLPTGAVVNIIIHHKRYIDIHINPSVLDDGKPRGLCGKITNNSSKQLVLRNGEITTDTDIDYSSSRFQEAEQFVESWKVPLDKNLFLESVQNNYTTIEKPVETGSLPCQCTPGEDGYGEVECIPDTSYKPCKEDVRFRSVSKRNCKTNRFGRKRRSLPSYGIENFAPRREKRQISNNWNDASAESFCRNFISNSTIVGKCNQEVPAITRVEENALEVCKEDLKLTGSTEFRSSAVESIKAQCLTELFHDPMLQQETDSQPSVLTTIVQLDCLDDCSNHGTCNNGSCTCNLGYSGLDCADDINETPAMDLLEFEGLCDVRDNCIDISVFGGTFTQSVSSNCRMSAIKLYVNGTITYGDAHIEQFELEYFGEVVCPVPQASEIRKKRMAIPTQSTVPAPVMQETFTGYLVSVSNNGLNYSQQLPMVVYNSECMNCSNIGGAISCQFSEHYCVVDNQCYGNSESYKHDLYMCRAEAGERRWIIDKTKTTDPCHIYDPFPNSAMRLTSHLFTQPPMIDDWIIKEGWYGQPGVSIPSVTAPDDSHCGTRYPIYLQSAPAKVLNQEQTINACVRRYNSLCIESFGVKTKYCGNNFFVYYLLSSPIESSGFCLEHDPEI